MNFIEAMRYVAENERTAVMRPGARRFVWFDTTPFVQGRPPLGLRFQHVDDEEVGGYVPTIEDVVAEDWEVYEPIARPRL